MTRHLGYERCGGFLKRVITDPKLTKELVQAQADYVAGRDTKLFFECGGTISAEGHDHFITTKHCDGDTVYGVKLPHCPAPEGLRLHINDIIQLPTDYQLEDRVLWAPKLGVGDHWHVRAPKESFQERIRRVWQ